MPVNFVSVFAVAHEWSKVLVITTRFFLSCPLGDAELRYSAVLGGCMRGAELAFQPEVATRSREWGSCNDFTSCSIVFTFFQCSSCVGSWPYDHNK